MTDLVIVETADHARLSLKLSYNWQFEDAEKNPEKKFSQSQILLVMLVKRLLPVCVVK
jgi:hypothetical protein